MFKRRDSAYPLRERSRDWLKYKPQESVDLTITGFKAGGGKYDGLIGAVCFTYNGRTQTASGMSDAVRRDMSERPEAYIGRVAEFAFQCETTNGHLRHPQFKRMRPDK